MFVISGLFTKSQEIWKSFADFLGETSETKFESVHFVIEYIGK